MTPLAAAVHDAAPLCGDVSQVVARYGRSQLLAMASPTQPITVYDASGSLNAPTFQFPHTVEDEVTALAYSPQKRMLASGHILRGKWPVVVRLWDGDTRKRLYEAPSSNRKTTVLTLVFSPDGNMLASAHGCGFAVHNCASSYTDVEYVDAPAHTLSFPLNPNALVVANSHRIDWWDLATLKKCGNPFMGTFAFNVNAVVCSPTHADILVHGDSRGTVTMCNHSAQRADMRFQHGASISTLAFAPDGCHLASGDVGGWVKIWDMRMFQVVHSLRVSCAVSHLRFSPDGRTLAYTAIDQFGLLDKDTGLWLQRHDHSNVPPTSHSNGFPLAWMHKIN